MIRACCCVFASHAGSDQPKDGDVSRIVIDGEPETTMPPDQA